MFKDKPALYFNVKVARPPTNPEIVELSTGSSGQKMGDLIPCRHVEKDKEHHSTCDFRPDDSRFCAPLTELFHVPFH